MNRIDITTLKEIEKELGYFDIDQAYGSKHVYLRFGYWKETNLEKLQSIIGLGTEVIQTDFFDDDCGYKFSYKLI